MTTKMTRRTFLKGAAAAAAAVSLSGLLTGCGGGNWQTMRYDGMFSAAVNGCTLTQVAPTGRFTVTDSMGGKLHSTVEQELRLSFPNEGWRYQYQNGAMAVLTIKINGMTGTLYLVKRGNVYVATKIKPMN